MRSHWIKGGHRSLLVLALGWGQRCEHWCGKDFGNRDVLILAQWDAVGSLPDLSGYERYDLVAWSFGVWAVSQLDFGIEFAHAMAVNGTLFPLDDERGIPRQIFRLTVDGWQPGRSGRNFWRRMGAESLPERDDEALLRELRFFERWFMEGRPALGMAYDSAVIGSRDRIFPVSHQRKAWAQVAVRELDMPHDMEGQLEQILKGLAGSGEIDKDLVAHRFARSADTYDVHAVVQREMAVRLSGGLSDRFFGRALEFGCGTGVFSGMIRPMCGRLYRNDLVPGDGADYLCGDIECLELPGHLDLIAGNAVWQWLSEPRKMVRRFHEALNDGGMVAVSTFAPGTMGEVSKVLGVSLDYQTVEEFRALFQEKFRLLMCETYERVLKFASPLVVLKHLKHTGVTAAGGRFRWTKGRLAEFEQNYLRLFPDVTLTYEPVLLVAQKR